MSRNSTKDWRADSFAERYYTVRLNRQSGGWKHIPRPVMLLLDDLMKRNEELEMRVEELEYTLSKPTIEDIIKSVKKK